jgi:hypothetical protein
LHYLISIVFNNIVVILAQGNGQETPEGKVRQNWTTFSSPGFGIANFSFLAGKTSYLLITKLGLLTIKMLVLPRLSNFVQFHWTPTAAFWFSRLGEVRSHLIQSVKTRIYNE